jgi:hypothetical protein
MAGKTVKLAVLVDVCLELFVYLRMAYVTALLQVKIGGNVERCVSLGVAR